VVAKLSEVDAFQQAVNSQTKADALAFIREFGSSHLVPDLIDLLKAEVALEVCSSLPSGSSRARSACDKVKAAAAAVAVEPAAGSATPTAPLAVTTPTPTAPSAVASPALPASPAIASTPQKTKPAAAGASTATPSSAAPATQTSSAAEAPASPSQAPQSTPSLVIAPPSKPSVTAPTPPSQQAAVLPAAQPDAATATDNAASSAKGIEDSWRKLLAQFGQSPFRLNYRDRARGAMVVTYSGYLGRFIACGDAVGVAIDSIETGGAARDQLNSRMIIQLSRGAGGTTNLSVDAIHIVALTTPASRSPDVVSVRLDEPARASDGRYCWSTGEMERLAQLR
jgi:hypothetical protein